MRRDGSAIGSGPAEVIGRGATADVIAWRAGTVAKVFRPEYAYTVDLEHERARAVHALGAPCPAVFERIEHEGRPGIVFERVDGPLMLDALRDRTATPAQIAERLAELHESLHAIRVPENSPLPRLSAWIGRFLDELPAPERGRARAELAHVPDDTRLCHLDLHPGNVILRAGEPIVVDWVNACAGPVVLDVARCFVLMAWQSASRRDGSYQATRLELATRYRDAMQARAGFTNEDFARALGFGAEALLRAEPSNPYAPELLAAIPWRANG